MYCDLTFYFRICGSEIFYNKKTISIQFSTPTINVEKILKFLRKSLADSYKIPVEKVVPVSRKEYLLY